MKQSPLLFGSTHCRYKSYLKTTKRRWTTHKHHNQCATCSCSKEANVDATNIKLWIKREEKHFEKKKVIYRRKGHHLKMILWTIRIHLFHSMRERLGGRLTIGSGPWATSFYFQINALKRNFMESKRKCVSSVSFHLGLHWSHPGERHLSFRHLTIHTIP